MKKIKFNHWILSLAASVVLFSSNAFSQITLKFRQTNAKEVMSSIEKQSGYRFVYDESSIQFPQINRSICSLFRAHLRSHRYLERLFSTSKIYCFFYRDYLLR